MIDHPAGWLEFFKSLNDFICDAHELCFKNRT
jgi:hypothetical protein